MSTKTTPFYVMEDPRDDPPRNWALWATIEPDDPSISFLVKPFLTFDEAYDLLTKVELAVVKWEIKRVKQF